MIDSIMMIHTRPWRSRRRLRRTYSTKHTGQTVSCVYHNKEVTLVQLQFMSVTCIVAICVSSGEIALLEGLTVVYKSNIDLFFYVIGSSHENEVSLILRFCNRAWITESWNPTIEQWANPRKFYLTTVSNPILSLTANVMVWIRGDDTMILTTDFPSVMWYSKALKHLPSLSCVLQLVWILQCPYCSHKFFSTFYQLQLGVIIVDVTL